MSIFNEPSQNASSEYNFASGDISVFMDEFNTPKQHQDIQEDDFPDFEVPEDETDNVLPDKLQTSTSVARSSASMLTIALDSSLSSVFGLIANDSPDTFRADSAQREELQKALTEYIKLKGGDIPPGVTLIILILSIYGGKGVMAVQLRKANKRNEELEKENARLKALDLERNKIKPEKETE